MSKPPWIDDYHALIEGRGVAVLDGWSSLVAAGPDAVALLNNFCTNDILKLDVGAACEAFFPNVKGKVVAFGWVWRTDDDAFRVVLGSPRAEELHGHLDRYVIREDVALSVGDQQLALTKTGNATADAAVGLAAFDDAQLLLNPADGPTGVSVEAFDAWRIEQGVPLDGADVDDRNLPQELARDASAISFTKGCYLGQETVARLDALGHVNQQLVLLRLDDEVEPGAELIAEDKVVGRVTSTAWSPKHSSVIAIGYVRREHSAVDTRLACGNQHALVCG